VDNRIGHASHLVLVRAFTGRTLAPALEPDPHFVLESIDDLVCFVTQHVFASLANDRRAYLFVQSNISAEQALQRHTRACHDGRLTRHLDLPQAFAALASDAAAAGAPREWRIHFHVPIFLAEIEHFSTTQDFLREILALHRADPVSAHLEVETYSWDVLPE